jgi:transketolase C-terminal domain/subunit
MRNDFATAVERIGRGDDKVVSLLVNLGYNMLESVISTPKLRFVTIEIADQNMVELAAGTADEGGKVGCYSCDEQYHPQPSRFDPVSLVRQLQYLMN